MRKPLNVSEFNVQIHARPSRKDTLSVNIHENGKFNLNGNLNEKLKGKTVCLRFTSDAKHFMLIESDDPSDSFAFPKSGSRKLTEVFELLKRNKISFPASHLVWKNENGGFWQGDFAENPTQLRKS